MDNSSLTLYGPASLAQCRAMASPPRPVHVWTSGDLVADRRFAWGEAAAAEGDHAAAADLFSQTVELAPRWAPGWFALGEAREKSGDSAGAREAYARAAALDREGTLGAELALAALGGAPSPDRAPAAYVRDLFDQYAGRFDAHLVGALAYRAPEVLRAAVEAVGGGRGREPRFARMLDLGCGTGLAGRAFAELAARIEGVDLSPAMVAEAAKTGLYARLVAGGLVEHLEGLDPAAADFAVAADVFVYLGDLAPAFAACARALSDGGLFAFTTQRAEEGEWRVGADLRYAHSDAYLRAAAARAGFAVAWLEPVSTRRDAGADVPGLVCVLRKTSPARTA